MKVKLSFKTYATSGVKGSYYLLTKIVGAVVVKVAPPGGRAPITVRAGDCLPEADVQAFIDDTDKRYEVTVSSP